MKTKSRRTLVVISVVLLVMVAGALYSLPAVARHVAISQLRTITKRPVDIDRVDVQLLSGRVAVHGLRVAEPAGDAPFADCDRLEARLNLLSLLRGHIWVRDLVLTKPILRIVRLGEAFNFSDLIQGSESTEKKLDVTVDHFSLVDGTVAFEDRALPERRTWRSEDIQIEASNVSTLRDDGTVLASSVTAGAPNLVQIERFRLYPIHLEATAIVRGLDLALARLYLPADAPVVLDRGRMSSTLKVTVDARAGVRADLEGELEDLALVRPGERDPVTEIPRLTTRLADLTVQNDQFRLGQFELQGSASVRDPRSQGRGRYRISAIRASMADLTWPITTPGRLDVRTAIPGGGSLAVSGLLRPPPAASQLHLRLSDLDLASWNRFVPVAARLNGRGRADLRINEQLSAGVPARVSGSVAVDRLAVRDAQQELLGAQSVEATGLEVEWPTRLGVKRVVVSGPRAIVERDKDGSFPLTRLLNRSGDSAPSSAAPAAARTAPATANPPRIEIGEIAVRNGVVSWRDRVMTPAVAVDLSQVDVTVTGGGWPLRPLGVKLAVRPPGGGQLQVAGRVGVDPFDANLRVTAREAELAHYQPYVPSRAQFSGRADLDLAVVVPASSGSDVSELRGSVRGDAVLSRVDVRDGQRTIVRVGRASASALDIEWPRRIRVRELSLRRPWILLERDQSGAFPLRALLTPEAGTAPSSPGTAGNTPASGNEGNGKSPVTIVLNQLVLEEGGARVVDASLTPPFAVDVAALAGRIDGISTASGAKPASVDVKGRVGDGSLSLSGTVGAFGGPFRVDLNGELREFAVPRTNPYLVNTVAWEAKDGWLTTTLQARIDGDNLTAKTDILLSRLRVARASGRDEAQTRIGLPLGMIVSLMKNRRGDIHLSLPVGGRVNDPRFDYSEAIWSTLRNAAAKAITAPVSWIGRVRFSDDSRIQRIEINPIPFEPGTDKPTPEGREQLTRLVAFLDQTPETRLTATSVVSRRDLAAMTQPAVDKAIARVAREAKISPDEAAARVFQERLPGKPVPETPDAIRAALAEAAPPTEAATLSEDRLKALRAAVKKAGIDSSRLVEAKPSGEVADDPPQVKLDLAEPESTK